ncbi:hypothetical protein Vafri_15551 [Volvox africanus]|nr:hypothetical protein Vafri_15551 [Volvox africanus]
MLNEVLPAVVNTYYCSGSSGQQHARVVLSEPNFLRVNCFGCDGSSNGDFLRGFLIRLKESAADQQLFTAASTPVPSHCNAVAMLGAIQDFMRRLPRNRLNFLLIDEFHNFYLIRRSMLDIDQLHSSSTLDMDKVLQMRCILKELLLESPHWVAWAVTGGRMATIWANIAATPATYDIALSMRNRQLDLEPMASMGVLKVAWEQLKAEVLPKALPNDLVWWSPPQIATLAHLCWSWRSTKMFSTAAELVELHMKFKHIPQVLEDLRVALQVLEQPRKQLLILHELLDPTAGVEPAKLPMAFKNLLGSFATKHDGRLYLDNPLLAQVLQAITTESGELINSITPVQWISSEMFRELVVLGEFCKDSKPFNNDLHSLLEDMASALALPPDRLLKADWFVHVLDHRLNNHGSKVNYEQNYEAQAWQDAKVGLLWFHALLCNVLSHGSFNEQRQALEFYPPKLAEFHSSGRISKVVTEVYNSPMSRTYDNPRPRRSKAPGTSAAATPRTQLQPHVGPVRPIPLHLGKQLRRATVIQPRYMGWM